VSELSADIEIIITINEPTVYTSISYLAGMWPPMKKNVVVAINVLRHLAYAHNMSYDIIKKINPRFHVSIAHNSVYVYQGDKSLISRLGAWVAQKVNDDFILKRVQKKCDFLGVNYYMSFALNTFKLAAPNGPRSDLNWSFAPQDIKYVLERLYRTYKLPLIITENGIADATDTYRADWIKDTVHAIEESLENGVDIRGYIHWSLTDNFEWAFGTWPRFGLVEIDYESLARTIRPSARYYASVVAQKRNLH
jgi:beta-glucosidase